MRVPSALVAVAFATACLAPIASSQQRGTEPAPTETLTSSGEAAVGSLAPWFALWTPDGRIVNRDTASPATTATVIVFAAGWCQPCRRGLELLQLSEEALESVGAHVLVISVDQSEQDAAWLNDAGFAGRWAHDRFGVVSQTMGVTSSADGDTVEARLPLTVVLDSNRTVRAILRMEGDDYVSVIIRSVGASGGGHPGEP